MKRGLLVLGGTVGGLLGATTAAAILVTLAAGACPGIGGGGGGGVADAASAQARSAIPGGLLSIYRRVGAQYGLPWEILAGIGNEECSQGLTGDPSCAIQPGATGPGAANSAGASGLMQIGVGGAAGDAYDALRGSLSDPALGPHDPLTSVQLAALVLIKDKGAPTGRPIDAYRPYVRAYNGAGAAADAYAARVLADAHRYQGSGAPELIASAPDGCLSPATASAGGYVDPFAHAQVAASRIDQGVDYGGSGPIDALGPGRVVRVSVDDTGWGNGDGWVSYQLTAGRYAGDYVYVAEGITPTVTPGQTLAAGQQVGTFNGHSIEIGFASDAQSDSALAHTVYSEGADTAAGRAMNSLLTSVGAPSGHRDTGGCGGPCPIIGGPVPAPAPLGVRI